MFGVCRSAGTKRKMEEAEGTSVTVDVDLLDCTICFLPLRPPLFQCRNGHVACPSCRDKHRNECPTCTLPINYSHCFALEKLIESVKLPCSNNGCKKNIPYADLREHEEDTCIHAPFFFCPIPDCSFSGSIHLLLAHVDNSHKDIVKRIKSESGGQYITNLVRIERSNPLYVIRFDNYDEIFLLVNDRVSLGNALSMTCICQQTSSEYRITYELSVDDYGEGSSLKMKAPMITKSLRGWTGPSYPNDPFLLVPQKFGEVGTINVYIGVYIGILEKKTIPSVSQESASEESTSTT